MSALQRINNIQRLNQNANLEDARRRSYGRLNFLRRGRTDNVAAIVRPQPPLPAGSLALPPSDAIQSRQWAAFSPSRRRELSNDSPVTPALGSHNNTRPELDTFRTRTELDAFPPSVELDASRAFYQLDGGQVSIHTQSPISPVSQITNASRFQEPIHTGDGSHDGMILELEASSQEVHQLDALSQQAHQLDGECVMQEPVSLSCINPLACGTTTSGSRYAHIPTIERTRNRTASTSFVAPLRPLGVEARADGISAAGPILDNPVCFDCPIRAGPNGTNLCSWPPRSDIRGFPTLARVREHVGSHGLPCPDCDKVFTKPTRYRDHRKNKIQTGTCSDIGFEKSSFPKHLAQSPEIILRYFERTGKDISDHDAWLNGYKILHPDWEREGSLPSSFYTENIANKQLPLALEMLRNDQGHTSQSSNSSQSHVAASFSTSQSTHHTITPLTEDAAGPNFDLANRQLTRHIPDDLNFGQLINDSPWADSSSGEHHLTNNTMEDMMSTMSGALQDSMEASAMSYGSQMSQNINNSIPTAWDFSTGATMVAGDQLYTANANTLDVTKQLSLHTSMLSNEGTSNPFWQAGSRVADDIDSAMELCDTPDSQITGVDKSFLNHWPQSFMARGIAKPPARPARAKTPARQNAVKRAEKLAVQVAKLTARELELRAQIKVTKSENSSLRRRIEEVESEKDHLMDTLVEIRNQVDAWDLDDGEALEVDSLNHRMQKIKLLLPHC